jgi:hypothetical protein
MRFILAQTGRKGKEGSGAGKKGVNIANSV